MDELISRRAAICSLDDEITITGKANAYVVKDYVQRVKRKLENLPSVQPEIVDCKYHCDGFCTMLGKEVR